MTLGLYVHFPFCLQKCLYCDFLSGPSIPEEREKYIKALAKEIELEGERLSGPHRHIHSIFFGGGTPTVLEAHELVNILGRLREYFSWNGGTEVTIEANPGTVTLETLRTLKKGGFNRLSFGVQTFNPKEISLIGRQHTLEEVYQGFHWAREAGFHNLNLDLIYALPGQTIAGWQETLKKAVELKPDHISAYGLKIEEGTPFEELVAQGEFKEVSEELNDEMYQWTIEYLEKVGYSQYEISNFSLPTKESRHNLGYWQQEPYIGFGLGATSYLDKKRWIKKRNMKQYLASISLSLIPIEEEELLTESQALEEAIILGLRLTEGIDMEAIGRAYGINVEAKYESITRELEKMKLLERKGSRIRLSSRGLSLGNQVFMAFLND